MQDFILVIDTREQAPYKFKEIKTIRQTLKTGDYSIKGYEKDFAIERKSFSDFVGSITHGRKRFEKEMLRAKKLKYFALILEFDMNNVWTLNCYSKTNRKSVLNTAIFWSVKYNIPVFFTTNRKNAEYLIISLCKAWLKYQPKKMRIRFIKREI